MNDDGASDGLKLVQTARVRRMRQLGTLWQAEGRRGTTTRAQTARGTHRADERNSARGPTDDVMAADLDRPFVPKVRRQGSKPLVAWVTCQTAPRAGGHTTPYRIVNLGRTGTSIASTSTTCTTEFEYGPTLEIEPMRSVHNALEPDLRVDPAPVRRIRQLRRVWGAEGGRGVATRARMKIAEMLAPTRPVLPVKAEDVIAADLDRPFLSRLHARRGPAWARCSPG